VILKQVPILRAVLLASVVSLATLSGSDLSWAIAPFVPAAVATIFAVLLESTEKRTALAWAWSFVFAATALGVVVLFGREEDPSLDRLTLWLLGAVIATSRNRIAGVLVGLMASGALVYLAISHDLTTTTDLRLGALGMLLLAAGTATGLAQEEGDESVHLRAELADLGEHLRNVLSCVASGVLVVDLERRVSNFNRAAGRILGVQEHVVLGRDVTTVLEDLAPLFQPGFPQEGRRDVRFSRPDGKEILLGYALTTLENRGGRRLGTILVFQDVTLIRDYEERMLRQEKLAALGRLVSGIAHEFGNQLGGARGLVQLALLDEPQEAVKSLPIVEATLSRSLQTVDNLLRFARNTPLDPVPGVQLEKVIGQALSLLKAKVDGAGLEVEIQEVGQEQTIVADAGQLEQVFLNLVINALHATEGAEHPRLRITLQHGDTCAVLFEDNGPGVPDEVRERIFEPFFTTKGALGGSQTPGTGLGLAMALGIVEGHGGTLAVGVSADLAGACFAVGLPSTKGEGSGEA
jgi:PAS domain S-box-containing protein